MIDLVRFTLLDNQILYQVLVDKTQISSSGRVFQFMKKVMMDLNLDYGLSEEQAMYEYDLEGQQAKRDETYNLNI